MCPVKYKKAPILNEETKQDEKVNALVIQVDEAEDNERFFGLSLSDIPFIDDSKYSSRVDLSRNPYQPLTNST
jgi:hypothetical protein